MPAGAKGYDDALVTRWCAYANDLRSARLLDRSLAAYRRVNRAGDAGRECGADAKVANIQRVQRTRERRLERARAWRRAADLRKRRGHEAGRRAALRISYVFYVAALEQDPFASGGRRAFQQLIGTYRTIEPVATDCARAAELVDAGLLPEARLFVSRALRVDPVAPCAGAMAALQARRTDAYQHLRDGEAHEAAGDERAASRSFVAAVRADSSQRSALAGLKRVEPPPLRKENELQDDAWAVLETVGGVLPKPAWAAILWVVGILAAFTALWGIAWLLAKIPGWPRALIDRTPVFKGVRRRVVDLELPPDLGEMRGYIDDTVLQLNSPPVTGQAPPDGLIAGGAGVVGAPVAVPVSDLPATVAATPSLAIATELLRLGTNRLRPRSKVALALEGASCQKGSGLELEQRWRVFDRRTRRTLDRVAITVNEDDYANMTRKELEAHFTQTTGLALQQAVAAGEAAVRSS